MEERERRREGYRVDAKIMRIGNERFKCSVKDVLPSLSLFLSLSYDKILPINYFIQ